MTFDLNSQTSAPFSAPSCQSNDTNNWASRPKDKHNPELLMPEGKSINELHEVVQ